MIPASINQSQIPHQPGVYIFKNSSGKILYVGKAVDLYHRVASYFSASHLEGANLKTITLVEHIAKCQTIEVSSELEALILEANLIKKYLPPYNIKLTDSKDYLYIKITKEKFPKILTARKNELVDAKEFFGPFPSAKIVRSTLKKLRRIFPWCSNPDNKRHRPCFHYHLHLCPGACIGKISQKQYQPIINRFSFFLQGKKEKLLEDLTREMKKCSQRQEFEKAEEFKKMAEGIEYLTQPTSIQSYLENPNFLEEQNKLSLQALKNDLGLEKIPERIECFDISNIQGKAATGSLVVLTGGEIDKKWYRKFKIHLEGKANDVAMMREVARRRLKHQEWPFPDFILVDGGKGQVGAAFKEIVKEHLNSPIFGLAKKLEWLYTTDQSIIKLPRSSLSLRLLQKIRDEAHCFALSFHRKLRDEGMKKPLYNV